MDHNDGNVRIGALGDLILDVHLVDGDVSAVNAGAEKAGCGSGKRVGENRAASDEEAALFFEEQ